MALTRASPKWRYQKVAVTSVEKPSVVNSNWLLEDNIGLERLYSFYDTKFTIMNGVFSKRYLLLGEIVSMHSSN